MSFKCARTVVSLEAFITDQCDRVGLEDLVAVVIGQLHHFGVVCATEDKDSRQAHWRVHLTLALTISTVENGRDTCGAARSR